MTARIVSNEFAKMKRLRIGLLAAILFSGVAGITAFRAKASGMFTHLGDADGFAWKILLAGLGFSAALISPLVLAVLASRQVEVEHRGNGWLLAAASGVTPGHLCRAKFASVGLLVATATVLQALVLIGFGLTAGITSPFPLEHWVGYTAAALVINLAVLAFHILLSAKIENQMVCMGIAVLGLFIGVFGSALPDWLSRLFPWGYYALAAPADYVGTDLVYLDLPYVSVVVLAVVGTALFLFITSRFDHQEL